MKTQAQKRAQARRAAMRGWQEGKWLGGNRYPREHPWNGNAKPVPPTDPSRYARSLNHRLTLEEITEGGHFGSGHKVRSKK